MNNKRTDPPESPWRGLFRGVGTLAPPQRVQCLEDVLRVTQHRGGKARRTDTRKNRAQIFVWLIERTIPGAGDSLVLNSGGQ